MDTVEGNNWTDEYGIESLPPTREELVSKLEILYMIINNRDKLSETLDELVKDK